IVECRKTMQIRIACAIGVEGENRAIARATARPRCAIQGVAEQNQTANRIGSIAVGVGTRGIGGGRSEAMQAGEARAISTESKHGAKAGIAATSGSPVQGSTE